MEGRRGRGGQLVGAGEARSSGSRAVRGLERLERGVATHHLRVGDVAAGEEYVERGGAGSQLMPREHRRERGGRRAHPAIPAPAAMNMGTAAFFLDVSAASSPTLCPPPWKRPGARRAGDECSARAAAVRLAEVGARRRVERAIEASMLSCLSTGVWWWVGRKAASWRGGRARCGRS